MRKTMPKINFNLYRTNQCQSMKILNLPSYQNIDKIHYGVTVKNTLEEVELINSLIWRQKTNMPVVKVVSFYRQSPTTSFPKTYNISIQSINNSISVLNGLELNQALYLLEQCIFGVQALGCKYRLFDLNAVFYCVNSKFQCRTWLSQNLVDYKPRQISLPTHYNIIDHIITKITPLCTNNCKFHLQQLFHILHSPQNINFTQSHIIILRFARSHKILLPKSLNPQTPSISSSTIKSQILQHGQLLQNTININKGIINFRYNGTRPSTNYQKKQQKINFRRNNKPHVTWSYDQSAMYKQINSSDIQSTKRIKCDQTGFDIKPNWETVTVISSQKQLKVSNNDIIINQFFNKQNQNIIKTCSSVLISPQNIPKLTHQCQNIVKNSVSTTYQSNNKYSAFIKDQSQLIAGIAPNQNCDITHQYHHANTGQYNFGGLIPYTQNLSTQTQHNENIGIVKTKRTSIITINKSQKYLKQLIDPSHQQKVHKNIYGITWMKNIVNVFESKDNLKQSIYYGEDKKSDNLMVKLELISKFGRPITSSNVVPENLEF